MSKGLQALERIIETFYDKESEDIKTVRKNLMALEIIKPLVELTKGTSLCWLWLGLNGVQITQEQYDLLKEVLKDD